MIPSDGPSTPMRNPNKQTLYCVCYAPSRVPSCPFRCLQKSFFISEAFARQTLSIRRFCDGNFDDRNKKIFKHFQIKRYIIIIPPINPNYTLILNCCGNVKLNLD